MRNCQGYVVQWDAEQRQGLIKIKDEPIHISVTHQQFNSRQLDPSVGDKILFALEVENNQYTVKNIAIYGKSFKDKKSRWHVFDLMWAILLLIFTVYLYEVNNHVTPKEIMINKQAYPLSIAYYVDPYFPSLRKTVTDFFNEDLQDKFILLKNVFEEEYNKFIDMLVPTDTEQYSCDGKVICAQFSNCIEATYYYNYCPNDQIAVADDGVICPELCE